MGKDGLPMPHQLTLKDRKQLTMTGVTEVVSFDENSVMLRTSLGDLMIQGQQLQLRDLTLEGGKVCVEGQIFGMTYEEPRTGGWLRRLMG